MGNRAVITDENKSIGVYLHWNGGRDSVEGFLAYCYIQEFRNPNLDCYGWARLCQVITNFIGGGLSVGIDSYDNLDKDNRDNGVYVIDENWFICDRLYYDSSYGEQDGTTLMDMLTAINDSMPEDYRKSKEVLETGAKAYKKAWEKKYGKNNRKA